MPRLAVLALLFALGACDDQCDEQHKHTDKIAEAPDGTTLWRDSCSGVYFSSSGTQYTVRHGKTTSTVRVPNARAEKATPHVGQ